MLRDLRPGRTRLLAALLTGVLAAGLGWFVGASTSRTALAAVAVVGLLLLVRTAEPLETRWPQPPARRTRPGWHVVAGTQRALEAARTDRDDRRAVQERLDALDAATPGPGPRPGEGAAEDPGGGPGTEPPTDPRVDAARAAVGLPPSQRRAR